MPSLIQTTKKTLSGIYECMLCIQRTHTRTATHIYEHTLTPHTHIPTPTHSFTHLHLLTHSHTHTENDNACKLLKNRKKKVLRRHDIQRRQCHRRKKVQRKFCITSTNWSFNMIRDKLLTDRRRRTTRRNWKMTMRFYTSCQE